MIASQVAGSFRDPSGHVYRKDGRIFRTITHGAVDEYRNVAPTLRELVQQGRVIDFKEHLPASVGFADSEVAVVLEHPVIDVWSFPYEWSFSLLRQAALFHLDLHLDLLDRGLTLSDASAYNVQFVGPNPIFIDHLSVRTYQDGEFWLGHKQFCEQFLNPLLMRAYLDIAPNAWYRGALEGLPTGDVSKLLPFRAKVRIPVLTNVILPAKFQKNATSEKDARHELKKRQLPLIAFRSMLRQLRAFIDKMHPADSSLTTWSNYATTTTYDGAETLAKKLFVSEFVRDSRALHVIDLGCNTGEYSKICLEAGAARVTGFDFDQQSLDKAHRRAKDDNLDFLPLFLDARNPSPSQGWLQTERPGFSERISADAVIALAFEHHLTIAHNAPLTDVVAWIVNLAPQGVIEFVPKEDPTVQKMLALREDVFETYTRENFEIALSSFADIGISQQVSSSGRTLYAFRRR